MPSTNPIPPAYPQHTPDFALTKQGDRQRGMQPGSQDPPAPPDPISTNCGPLLTVPLQLFRLQGSPGKCGKWKGLGRGRPCFSGRGKRKGARFRGWRGDPWGFSDNFAVKLLPGCCFRFNYTHNLHFRKSCGCMKSQQNIQIPPNPSPLCGSQGFSSLSHSKACSHLRTRAFLVAFTG